MEVAVADEVVVEVVVDYVEVVADDVVVPVDFEFLVIALGGAEREVFLVLLAEVDVDQFAERV